MIRPHKTEQGKNLHFNLYQTRGNLSLQELFLQLNFIIKVFKFVSIYNDYAGPLSFDKTSCKGMQDSLGFWIPCRGFWISGNEFRILCQWNWDSGLQS